MPNNTEPNKREMEIAEEDSEKIVQELLSEGIPRITFAEHRCITMGLACALANYRDELGQ